MCDSRLTGSYNDTFFLTKTGMTIPNGCTIVLAGSPIHLQIYSCWALGLSTCVGKATLQVDGLMEPAPAEVVPDDVATCC